jgi:ATP-dependent RNA helicase RhlE
MHFTDFGLSQPLLRAVSEEGYSAPTPIQCAAVPHVLQGRDVLACAQTGTGKTAAFALPILERLLRDREATEQAQPRKPRVLVLSPTRELASQIGACFDAYANHTQMTSCVVVGGVNLNRQVRALSRPVDVLIATPGRLLDLMRQRAVSFEALTVLVLDECDRMLEMGFIQDVRRIVAALPKQRQTLLFSATMPDSIRSLAEALLNDPIHVAVTPVASTAVTVEQQLYFVEKADKRHLLTRLLHDMPNDRALVFTRTKHTANRVAGHLMKAGITADAIHGNKSQSARERALASFKQGELRALVATDIAARGIDIDRLACVINYDLPNVPEAYVHRIGRTGRAGSSGLALSFCEATERPQLRSIERLTRAPISVIDAHPFAPQATAAAMQIQAQDRVQRPQQSSRPAQHPIQSANKPNPPAHRSNQPILASPSPHGDDVRNKRRRPRRRGNGGANGHVGPIAAHHDSQARTKHRPPSS